MCCKKVAESLLYGLVKCVAETSGVKSALFDVGILLGGVIKLIQVLRFEKTSGDSNPSEFLHQEPRRSPRARSSSSRMSMKFIDGRASAAPQNSIVGGEVRVIEVSLVQMWCCCVLRPLGGCVPSSNGDACILLVQ